MFDSIKDKFEDFLEKTPFGNKKNKRSRKLLGFNSRVGKADESYKHLRTFLLNNTKHEYCPVFAVVSPKEKGGSTITAANLANTTGRVRFWTETSHLGDIYFDNTKIDFTPAE